MQVTIQEIRRYYAASERGDDDRSEAIVRFIAQAIENNDPIVSEALGPDAWSLDENAHAIIPYVEGERPEDSITRILAVNIVRGNDHEVGTILGSIFMQYMTNHAERQLWPQ